MKRLLLTIAALLMLIVPTNNADAKTITLGVGQYGYIQEDTPTKAVKKYIMNAEAPTVLSNGCDRSTTYRYTLGKLLLQAQYDVTMVNGSITSAKTLLSGEPEFCTVAGDPTPIKFAKGQYGVEYGLGEYGQYTEYFAYIYDGTKMVNACNPLDSFVSPYSWKAGQTHRVIKKDGVVNTVQVWPLNVTEVCKLGA